VFGSTGTISTLAASTLDVSGATTLSDNVTVSGTTQLDDTNGLQFGAGQNVNTISVETNLGGTAATNTVNPTQLAIKTYVDSNVAGVGTANGLTNNVGTIELGGGI